jgi:CubicO group peptidase (beta-lactamase class C family)
MTEIKVNTEPDHDSIEKIIRKLIAKRDIYGAVFHLSSGNSRVYLTFAAGNIQDDSQYYIASINKLFISALVLRLYREKLIDLKDKISRFLPEETVRGLHIYMGKDHSNDVTIEHLISQTSGLPCYLIDKQANGRKAMSELESGIDQAWPTDRVIVEVKMMKTHFPPGKGGHAKYIDTNHQLLSLILEKVTGEPINAILTKMFEELNLKHTEVYENTKKLDFIPIRYKSKIIDTPLYLTSTKNDIISTAKDQMIFLKAFFRGYFFPVDRMGELEKWNNIFFPFKYGIGIQKFSLPRLFSPFRHIPDMLGHCGSTGSVAFFIPEMDLYITGTINQQSRPNLTFQTMIKILKNWN